MTMPPLDANIDPFMDPLGGVQGEEMLGVDMDAIIREALGESTNPLSPNEQVAPNAPDKDGRTKAERLAALRKALYGADFPMATPGSAEDMDAWASWTRGLWESRRESVQMHLHLVERNRLFRAGQQWISSKGVGPWSEPARPRDAARVVYNMVDKALDQRMQIIMDQRP
jgi:hypothetical protein